MSVLTEAKAEGLVDRLERILEACIAAQEEVAGVLGRKQAASVKMNLPLLEAANSEMEVAAVRWTELETARRATVEALAERLRTTPDRLDLREIIGLAEEPRRGRLATLRARLKSKAAQVAHLHAVDLSLTEVSLDYVRDMLRLLTRGGEKQPTYGPDGKEAPPRGGLPMIDHVA